jgi:RNA polymerase sigma-70 factor (ECF subfamily)
MRLFNSKKRIFSEFYDKQVDKIYRFIFLKTNSRTIGQDLTSETFLRFWKSLEKGTEIENPRAFVYQIARNLIIDYYRQKERLQTISAEEEMIKDPRLNLEQEAIIASDIAQVQRALSEISNEYQDVLIWYYLDELSVREIAEILGKSENAVRVSVHRGLKALRQAIGPKDK